MDQGGIESRGQGNYFADKLRNVSRPTILISEPRAAGDIVLPYLWAILKSHWEHQGFDPKAFTWMDPIYLRESVERKLGESFAEPPDVLGLSCYTWNLPAPGPVLRMLVSAPVHIYTRPTEVPTVFDFSPYIEQSQLYERIMAQHGNRWVIATWETNRGCPYGCSFC